MTMGQYARVIVWNSRVIRTPPLPQLSLYNLKKQAKEPIRLGPYDSYRY